MPCRGNFVGYSGSNQVYVNADLPPLKREHNLIRAVLFWLGMTGNSVEPSSIFSPENDDQINLSMIDWKAFDLII